MKKLLILFLFIGIANAGIFDVFKIKDAQEAYKKSDYNTTIQNYSKIKNPSDEVRYNLGEAYYKDKKYKQALSEFKAIKSKKLEFKKLHNMGNTLAHLKKIDDAIKAYEQALKIKEDKDTRYNLELLKKMKKKQQQKKKQNKKNKKNDKKKNQQNKNKQKKNGGKGQDKKNKQNKNSKQNQKNQQNKQNQNNKKEQENKNKQNSQQKQKQQNKKQNRKDGKGKDKKDKQKEKGKEKLSEAQKKKQEQAKKQKMGKDGKPKKLPISDMELRKYNKALDKRGIKTLLLPINTKGAKQNEKNINPW